MVKKKVEKKVDINEGIEKCKQRQQYRLKVMCCVGSAGGPNQSIELIKTQRSKNPQKHRAKFKEASSNLGPGDFTLY